MTAKTFDFDPDAWFKNKKLRSCSPAARGFWVDLLAIMHEEGGYLTVNGRPIDDAQLSRLVGEPAASIRKWFKELGEAGVFDIAPDNRLYSSKMVRRAQFVQQAKKHGEAGQRKKREVRENPDVKELEGLVEKTVQAMVEGNPLPKVPASVLQKPPAPQPKVKAAPWWKTPAGWARYGQQQALSMAPDEAYEDFQCRLSARIPPGPHLEVLSPYQLKMVERLRPKNPSVENPS